MNLEGLTVREWMGKKLRPPKAKIAETPDKDPRKLHTENNRTDTNND